MAERTSFRIRIAAALTEVISIVFAVVVALAADEWRENRQLQQQADAARAAVVRELRANRDELAATEESIEAAFAGLERAAAEIDSGQARSALRVDLSLPDLSSGAWEGARLVAASGRFDVDWLVRVAQLYETQKLYDVFRIELLRSMGELSLPNSPELVPRLAGQVGVLRQLHGELADRYDTVLAGET